MVVWEVYEYQRGVIVYDGLFDYFDTLKDLVFGFLGGYVAYKKK
jgi:hypothetical protein